MLLAARLLLRPPQADDAAAIAALADNPRIAFQTARMPYPYTQAHARDWIARQADTASETVFVALHRQSGEVLGAAGFGVLDAGEAELGYWIGEPYWGRGYATEAATAVIDHAFDARDVPRLMGRCRTGNPASQRVLEKCGFTYRGPGTVHSRALKATLPTHDFVLERADWKRRRCGDRS